MSSNETKQENKNWFVNSDGDITDGDALIAEPNYLSRDGHKNARLIAASPELTLFILFVFSVGMVWGWSMARDRFHSRDYILGFNKGYDVGARFAASCSKE